MPLGQVDELSFGSPAGATERWRNARFRAARLGEARELSEQLGGRSCATRSMEQVSLVRAEEFAQCATNSRRGRDAAIQLPSDPVFGEPQLACNAPLRQLTNREYSDRGVGWVTTRFHGHIPPVRQM